MIKHEAWLCNARGLRLLLADKLNKFSIVKTINAPSYCSITIPGNLEGLESSMLAVDSMIEFSRQPANGSMKLESVFFMRDITYFSDQNGNDLIKLGGPDAIELLARRIVAYAAGTSQASKTDQADDMCKTIVRENLGASATDTDRDLSSYGVTVAADSTAAPSITKGFSWRNVLMVLQDIAKASAENGTSLYFDMVPQVASGKSIGFEFRTYIDQPGADRTYATNNPVVFSAEWGNLGSPRLRYDYTKEFNYLYGGGQGEGSDRNVRASESVARVGASIWNRRERFIDVRNESTNAGVDNKTEAELNSNEPKITLTGDLLDSPTTQYGKDWHFGDKVEMSYQNINLQGIAKSMKIELASAGREILTVKAEAIQ